MLKIKPHLILFPVKENNKCKLGGIFHEENWQGKWNVLEVKHQTEIEETRDGRDNNTRWVTYTDRIFIPKSAPYQNFFREIYQLAVGLGIEMEDLPYAEEINNMQGNVSQDLLNDFVVQFVDMVKTMIQEKRYGVRNYYLKTVIGEWKGFACTKRGSSPYISTSDDLEYYNEEDKLNHFCKIKPD